MTLPAGQHRLALKCPIDYVNITWITSFFYIRPLCRPDIQMRILYNRARFESLYRGMTGI
ncbi:hypothetical protein Mpal_2073 [Methanosphaerula palustris E1-9c]|uniref:Uncharacterized protein n=2 Tax=Methanosphaerula palustris TaxID=475088 RepID=B8GDM0_METPE|nr:hypothetical protein Mpal_2073 [Methanosphaerula palustris E1-9c]